MALFAKTNHTKRMCARTWENVHSNSMSHDRRPPTGRHSILLSYNAVHSMQIASNHFRHWFANAKRFNFVFLCRFNWHDYYAQFFVCTKCLGTCVHCTLFSAVSKYEITSKRMRKWVGVTTDNWHREMIFLEAALCRHTAFSHSHPSIPCTFIPRFLVFLC